MNIFFFYVLPSLMEAQVHHDEAWKVIKEIDSETPTFSRPPAQSTPIPRVSQQGDNMVQVSLPIPVPSQKQTKGSAQQVTPEFSQRSQSSSEVPDFLTEEKIQKLLGTLSPIPASLDQRSRSDGQIFSMSMELDSSPVLKSSSESKVISRHIDKRSDSSESTITNEKIQKKEVGRKETMSMEMVITPVAVKSAPDKANDSMERKHGPSQTAKEISAAVRQVRYAAVKCVNGEIMETGMIHHNFDKVSRSDIDIPPLYAMGTDNSKRIYKVTIPELMVPIREQINVTFNTVAIAKFLMVAKNVSTSRWTIPSLQRFHDVLNHVENRVRKECLQCQFVIQWNSEWQKGIGLMGLQVTDAVKLDMFRSVLADIRIGGFQYNSFPKSALLKDSEVSIMIKNELKSLDLRWIPHSLFEKNRLLDGNMAVRFSGPAEQTEKDEVGCKAPDRLVILEGDDRFIQSIQKYPPNHVFKLGSSTVTMRYDQDTCEFLKPSQPSGALSQMSASSSSFVQLSPDEPKQTFETGNHGSAMSDVKSFQGRGRGRTRGFRGKRGAPYYLKSKRGKY